MMKKHKVASEKEEKGKRKTEKIKFKKVIKEIHRERLRFRIRNNGLSILINYLIFIPVFLCLLCYAINMKTVYEIKAAIPLNEQALLDMLNTVLVIISIAVSVWIGLNIYNVYKKSDIDSSIIKLEESNRKLDYEYRRRKFLLQLEKTEKEYEVSKYFYRRFDCEEEIPLAVWDYLFEIEKSFADCCKAYERKERKACKKYTLETEISISALYKVIEREQFLKSTIVEMYADIRKSDSLYYKNSLGISENGEYEKELLESIEIYKRYNEIFNGDGDELVGYMLNTIGYSYLLLYKNCKDIKIDEKERRYDCAQVYLEEATEKNAKGRYFQNWGSCFEAKKDYDSAYICYQKALNAEKTDPKVYNLLGSVCLKQFEKMTAISERFNNEKISLLNDMNFESISEESRQKLEEGYGWFVIGLKQVSLIIDIYYNFAKASLYYWIFIDKRCGSKINECKIYLDIVEKQDEDNVGFKFTKRNYLEATGKIDEALLINAKIKSGDAKSAEIKYRNYLRERRSDGSKEMDRKFKQRSKSVYNKHKK